MTDTTVEAVESMKPQSGLGDAAKVDLVQQANRYVDDVYSGLVRTLSEIEGDEQDFKTLLAAHFWELAEGGEAQSENQAGGSISFNVQGGNIEEELALGQTRYGRMAFGYIRRDAQIGIEWA